jgi:hypothetical protein
MRTEQQIAKVMAARHDTTPPTITPTQPTTTEGNKMQNDRPLKFIPARLDAAACLQVLSKILATKLDTIEAAAAEVTLADVDAGLAKTELSLESRMAFKHALGQHQIIPAGRRTSISRI